MGIWKYRSIANRVGLGQHEAHELRDGDKGKWLGKGELKKQKKNKAITSLIDSKLTVYVKVS